MSLYQFLLDHESFTEAEAEETVLRYDFGMPIPFEVRVSIENYWKFLKNRGIDI